MNKKNLIAAFILLIICTIFAVITILTIGYTNRNDLSGQLVFANTANQGAHLDKVIITTSQSTTTIKLQDGFWRIAEGNDYYANMALTNALFTAMNNSRYFIPMDTQGRELGEYFLNMPKENDNTSGTLIQTFAGNTLLDEIIIGGTTKDNMYSFVRQQSSNEVWMINNDFTIPQKTYSWFQQPLLNYAPKQIRMYRTQIDDKQIEYKRQRATDEFSGSTGKNEPLHILSDAFNYMTFNNVVKNTDFDKTLYPHQRNLQITLFNGLVTSMDIYADEELKNFWTEIKISPTRLPTMGVNDYIKNNAFLYDGWIFRLSPEIGNILYKTFETK